MKLIEHDGKIGDRQVFPNQTRHAEVMCEWTRSSGVRLENEDEVHYNIRQFFLVEEHLATGGLYIHAHSN
jgi:hypothetical protein